MSKTYYNKLVRDRIPEILKSQGKDYEIDILSDEDYLKALEAKLDEEVAEYHENPCIEELADIFTVMRWIADARGYDWTDVMQCFFDKARDRGIFNHKIFLKWVDDGKEEN